MTTWASSVQHSLDEACETLAAAVRDCPHQLWEQSMWLVDPAQMDVEVSDRHGEPVTDPDQRTALVQRWSTPWSVAWHALEVLDYDLSGELDDWRPPPPFTDHPHWKSFTSITPWTPAQILGYIAYCRERVQDKLTNVTDDTGSAELPAEHRYQGKPYAELVTSLIGHTTAHAFQIRQFITAAADTSTDPSSARWKNTGAEAS